MQYSVIIRRVQDGLERECPQRAEWDGEDGDWSWWAEGNMSCDCNRELEFARAASEPEPDVQCSDGRFLVLAFKFPDGRVIQGPDA